jgi:hypothetical protein
LLPAGIGEQKRSFVAVILIVESDHHSAPPGRTDPHFPEIEPHRPAI